MILSEQYRPRTWGDVIGQRDVLAQLDHHREHGGLLGRAYWLVGLPGIGKTSIARLIAREVAGDWAIEELDAANVDTETCQRWEREAHTRPIGGQGWAKIINEAGSLRKAIVKRLLSLLEIEAVQRNMTIVFTTMPEEQKALFAGNEDLENAFGSRVDSFGLEPDLAAFAAHAQAVARAIGQDGEPLKVYLAMATDCDGNLREMLRRVEKGQVSSWNTK